MSKDTRPPLQLEPTPTTSTRKGRAANRHRRFKQSVLASGAAKSLAVITTLVSVPLTLNYLGTERYGMWMTMSALVAMFAFADLGMGNGVLALVAKAHGTHDDAKIRACVSNAFAALTSLALLFLVAFGAVYPFVSWGRLFNVVEPIARSEAGPAFAAFMIAFVLAIPLSIVQRVQTGLQQGFLASMWQCMGSVLALGGVLLAVRLQAGLPWLVMAFVGSPLLASALNSLDFFVRARPDIRPAWRLVSKADLLVIGKTGMLYFVLQIVVAVAYTSDSLIIAQVLGATEVAPFAVTERMFSFISMSIAVVLAPLWPAYAEALAQGDSEWMLSTLKRSLILGVSAAALLASVLVIFGKQIVLIWAGPAVEPSTLLLVAFAVWKVIETIGAALAMYLNGLHHVRFQISIAAATGIAAITGKILLVRVYGLPGVLWASILAFLVFGLLPTIWFLRRTVPPAPQTSPP